MLSCDPRIFIIHLDKHKIYHLSIDGHFSFHFRKAVIGLSKLEGLTIKLYPVLSCGTKGQVNVNIPSLIDGRTKAEIGE